MILCLSVHVLGFCNLCGLLPPAYVVQRELMFSQASVCLSTPWWGWAVPQVLSWGVPQSLVPCPLLGVHPSGQDWGTPSPPLPPKMFAPRAVCLLRFPAGGLSCFLMLRYVHVHRLRVSRAMCNATYCEGVRMG